RIGSANGSDDRFRRPAPAKGNHRRSARLRLDGDDAKVLFAGKEQRATAAQAVPNHLIRLPTEKFHLGPGGCTETSLVLTFADHDELPPQIPAGRDRQVDSLIRGKRRDDEVEIL